MEQLLQMEGRESFPLKQFRRLWDRLGERLSVVCVSQDQLRLPRGRQILLFSPAAVGIVFSFLL